MATATLNTLAIVCGAGPGTGAALATAFARGSAVALLARNQDSLDVVTAEVKKAGGDAAAFSCDVSSEESVDAAFAAIKERFPTHELKAAIFNANSPFVMKPFLELDKTAISPSVDVNVYGAFHFSQKVVPLLLKSGGGFLGFSGATASMKGSAKFAGFAPGKFALRALSQSLAREFGPQGIHVSHVVLDGIIDTQRTRGMFGGGEPEDGTRMDPAAIAGTFVHLAEQPKNCWTHELDLRPAAEKW
ncbi:hypothetical protein JCM10213_002494 [Rhodosporidiobolus nylandii]